MNVLLNLYLHLVRGPRIIAEQREKEEAARLRQEEENRKKGILPVQIACKKCDVKFEETDMKRRSGQATLCIKCLRAELAQVDQEPQETIQFTPFLVVQIVGIIVAMSVFVYRNVVPLIM